MSVETATTFLEVGRFTMPSGRPTKFKIECDMLTDADWATLATMASWVLPPFGRVEGVPEGGLAFARALKPHITEGYDRLLIADDVWVTGKSIEAFRATFDLTPIVYGVVAFVRAERPLPWWVLPIFQLNPDIETASYA